MKVKTSELISPALDWAVGVSAATPGLYVLKKPDKTCIYGKLCMPSGEIVDWPVQPSTDWSQGGPIIERELIDIQAKFNSGSNIVPKGQWYWQASTVNEDDVAYWFDGPTPLIAAMRCFVTSKLGDEVEIPEVLI